MPKKFKEYYLRFDKNGYFDEQFDELKISEICKKISIDKKDLDEIIQKTNFEVEGAIDYLKDKTRIFVKGEKNKVDFTKSELIMMEKNIHSHLKGTSFSIEDILIAIKNKILSYSSF